MFAILQKYDFSSKSQQEAKERVGKMGCLRYCKSTIFQANHNAIGIRKHIHSVVCDTAKVRFFKQITTGVRSRIYAELLFAILQKYDFSSKSQLHTQKDLAVHVVCDTAKVRFFKQITTLLVYCSCSCWLFAILQKYDFSSKSQRPLPLLVLECCCLRYCKSTIFQANHNWNVLHRCCIWLFAILQKYDFSSKSQQIPKYRKL